MSISIEIWEDSGNLVSVGGNPYGNNRVEVNNIGYKSTSHLESVPYVYYPIQRPTGTTYVAYSYKKYNFFKMYGTYSSATRLRCNISGNINSTARIYYKWTWDYDAPDATPLNGSYLTPGQTTTCYPMASTIGPQEATSMVNTFNTDTTYYSNYLVTQLYLEPSDWDDIGNISSNLTVQFSIDEYE